MKLTLMARLSLFFIGVACSGLLQAQISVTGELRVLDTTRFEYSKTAQAYLWDFGDGQSSTEAQPAHRYKKSGPYTVVLKATNDKGKIKTVEKNIQIDPPKACLVELETEFGSMLIQLYDATPKHQDNFVRLVEEGYFDSLMFHRVIQQFMIQGGDPDSRNATAGQPLGSGGPGYTVEAEFVDSLIHIKGALAAARTGDNVNPQKRSSGSQFYIVQGQPASEELLNRIEAQKGFRYSKAQRELYLEKGGTPFLDRDYTVFGQVVEGLDVLDKIAAVPADPRNRPLADVRMKISIVR
ncbi:MAG: peptidylprolyl isomerase [Phaeodactylibacter sp.]|nr:peptidylprolyl isomerase [Phaeodactylibacter sp.]MCB9275699.1 peptidylprolyl isomerase [Lewinellaceae bacterium]